MYYSTLTILILCNPMVHGTKVIDRFGGFYRTDLPCKFWWPSVSEELQKMHAGSAFKKSALLHRLKKLNCTNFKSNVYDFGYPLDNGSYTGLIGMVQRQETDLLMIPVRPDSLPHEPALIGPMFFEADATIISGKSKQHRVSREILELANDVDPLVYAYLVVSIIVFSFCYTISVVLSTANEIEAWDPLTVGKYFLKSIWESCAAVLDEEQFSPESYSSRILTSLFTLSLFFGIYGMFLNNVGAGLIRRNGPPNIDSIDYFVNNITHTKPVIVKKLYLLNILKNEPKDSTLGRLWSLMEKEQNETVLDVDKDRMEAGDERYKMELFGKITDVLQEIQTRTKALIIPRGFARNTKIIGCTMNPVNISRMYLSKETFAAGTLNPLMSHGIHPEIRKIIEYSGRSFNEAALLEGVLRMGALDIGDMIPGANAKLGLSALECVDGKPLTEMKDDPEYAAEMVWDEESFQKFSLFHLATLFKLWIYGLSGAFLLCMLEILYEYCKLILHYFLP